MADATAPRLKRRRDWAERLWTAVRADIDRPFVWYEHDCCRAVARWVEAMTGEDLFVPFYIRRNRYKGMIAAASAIRRVTGRPATAGTPAIEALAEHLAERHVLEEVPPALAQRGDVLLIPVDPDGPTDGVMLGLVFLDGRMVRVAGTGLLFEPRAALRAWRIPF